MKRCRLRAAAVVACRRVQCPGQDRKPTVARHAFQRCGFDRRDPRSVVPRIMIRLAEETSEVMDVGEMGMLAKTLFGFVPIMIALGFAVRAEELYQESQTWSSCSAEVDQ